MFNSFLFVALSDISPGANFEFFENFEKMVVHPPRGYFEDVSKLIQKWFKNVSKLCKIAPPV